MTAPLLLLLVQAPATGAVAGTLRDATTNEPLAGAVVAVIDLSRTGVTDSTGHYRIDGLMAGPHRLLVRRIGYAPRTLEALVPADATVEISVALSAEPIELSAVAGLDSMLLAPPPDTRVDMARVRDHPLLAEPDAFQALSGGIVAVQPESPAGMHVRGGAADQVTYLLDGFPVFSPYHSGESFSAWNPDALADAELRPASETWDALSGVISAASRTPGRQHHVYSGVSTTQMRLTVDGPLGGGGASSGAGYLWSERSGFAGFPVPQRDPTYLRGETGDRLVKLEAPVAGGRARVLGYTSENELDTDGPIGGGTGSRNMFAWQSTTLGAEWNRSGSAGLFSARAWLARADASATWQLQPSVERLGSRRRDVGLSLTLERPGQQGQTTVGIRVQASRMAYDMSNDSGPAVRYGSDAPLAALFVERMQGIGSRVGIVAALGATGSAGLGRLSPRATLSWNPARGLVLSGGYLRAYQFSQSLRNPESVAGTVFPVDLQVGVSRSPGGVPVARTDEGIVAAQYQPRANLRLTVHGYLRGFRDIVLVAPSTGDPFATAPFAIGTGAARGLAVDLSRTTERYSLFAGYSRQQVRFASDTTSYSPEYGASDAVDGGIVVQASHHVALRLGATGRFGRRATAQTTPFEWESCNIIDRGCEFAGSPRTNPDSLGAISLPAYVRVDVGIRSRWNVRVAGRATELALFGTLTNIFARSNALTLAPSPDPASGIRSPVTLRSRVPLVIGLDWAF